MIRINLAPADELENPYWFVPDVAAFVLVAIIGYMIVQNYLDSLKEEIDLVREQTASYQENYAKLKPELARFDSLEKEIAELNNRIAALNRITVSKIERFKPVIVLEHIQNLKPDGMWFSEVKFEEGGVEVGIKGTAFDNLIVSEFMTALLSTKGQAVDANDLRTQVYFDNLGLDYTNIGGIPNFAQYYQRFPGFELKFQFKDRQPNPDLIDNAAWFSVPQSPVLDLARKPDSEARRIRVATGVP